MKRLLALLISFAVLFALIPHTMTAVASGTPEIVCGSVSTAAGKRITVAVSVANNPGFTYLEMSPVYSDELTFVDVQNADLIADFTKGKQYVWIADEDVTEDGLLMTFTFDIAATVSAGEYSVGFVVRMCGNYDEEPIHFTVKSGTITVTCPHRNTMSVPEDAADCVEGGYTAGVWCNDCETYISGHEPIPSGDHTYDNASDTTCNVCGHIREVAPPKNGWVLEGGKWAFYVDDVKLTKQWQKDSKGWVYLGADGYMLTNSWCTDSKGWCYVGADGYAVTNCWKKDSIGWIWLDANGSMTKNAWVKDGGKWYFLDKNGYMVTSQWRKDSKGWVYLNASGAMLTNSWCRDSVGWCYVGADGYAVTNTWKKDSVGWCYLNSNGSMTKNNWVKDGGKWYYCDASGYMVANRSLTIGKKTYKFNASGVCTNP